MKAKTIISILVGTALSASIALAADFSKKSNDELINLSGKVTPKDYPDYKMEIHKRTQKMTLKEGRDFRKQLRDKRQSVYEQMTLKEYREYQDAIAKETAKRIDSMSEKEAYESGLLRKYHKNQCKGNRGPNRGDYPNRGYKECPIGPRP
ncbi:DUF1104 domain-containing protein [Helicobacter colisuis]|uniref:DUF1104 domain-containing protein n=1 Tax=Helicobacter colisuis TaxID=2949739 RepID=UPI00202A75D4|nr:DUF1104 domain-containing protein [Helicobacter colisuis]MCL9823028.1 DUF1104 domain-containing protein [Helicobacter colisuis]